jgi:predicted transcriptional regulator
MDKPARTKKTRKSIDLAHAAFGVLAQQDAVWAAVRQVRSDFSVIDIDHAIVQAGVRGVADDTIQVYLKRLMRGGFVKLVDQQWVTGGASRNIYSLIKDAGQQAPRLRADGTESTQGAGNEAMWRSIKMLKEFSYVEVLSTCGVQVSVSTIKTYLMHLQRAGYLVIHQAGGPNKPARYKLLPSMNTGPRAPMVQRTHRVFDANLKKVMWSEVDD